MEPVLHPDCAPLAALLGTWTGEGAGHYPTIPAFTYGEEVRFWHVGKPFVAYAQKTWALDDGRPMHAETGYFRPKPGGRVEIVLAHPTGLAEVQEGTAADGVIKVRSTVVARTESAKDVTALARTIRIDGDDMVYDVEMAAVGFPLTHHLEGILKRSG